MVHWFVRHSSGIEEGPFSEVQIRQGIESGSITDACEVRQQQSGWFPVAHVREVFRRLSVDGFYLKDRGGKVFGPFTKQRVLEFEQTNCLPACYWIRQGKQTEWTEIKTTLVAPRSTKQEQAASELASTQSAAEPPDLDTKSSPPEKYDGPAPQSRPPTPRPNIPAAPVMKLRGNGLLGRLGLGIHRIDDMGDALSSE